MEIAYYEDSIDVVAVDITWSQSIHVNCITYILYDIICKVQIVVHRFLWVNACALIDNPINDKHWPPGLHPFQIFNLLLSEL